MSAEHFGRAAWIWHILYDRGVIAVGTVKFRPAYPVLPWIGVMAAGYCLGFLFEWNATRRRNLLLRMGLALAAAFVVLRAINGYGDPVPRSHQSSPVFTVLSFVNVTKYPPSLDFLLMTFGPAMVVMTWLENFHFHSTNPLIVFGRVPFFYYGVHLFLAHLISIAMNFVRYGAKPFLPIAPTSMGSPSRLFPIGYASRFGYLPGMHLVCTTQTTQA